MVVTFLIEVVLFLILFIFGNSKLLSSVISVNKANPLPLIPVGPVMPVNPVNPVGPVKPSKPLSPLNPPIFTNPLVFSLNI